MYPPPPPPGIKKLDTGQSDILFLADVPPPQGMKKLDTGQSDILLLADVPPPPGMKKLDTGQSDILLLADVPPPRNEKVGYRSKWHFASGWCTPPPTNWNWTKHECYRKKIIPREVIKYILPIYPPPSIIIIWFYAWTGNWWISISNGYMDSNPIHQPSPAKKLKLIFGLHSTSGDWLGWSMDSNPIHQPSPAKKIKCSFLDYIQLLMIGRAGWWTRTPSATPLQPKK